MSQYLDKDGATRIAENFLSKQAEQDAILRNLQFDLKEAERALVKTIQGPAPLNIRALSRPLDDYMISGSTIQDGTPTPEAPVDVVGCGVRTGNLWSNRGFSTTTITSNHTHNISNNYGTTLSTTEGDEVTITQSAYPTGDVGYQNGFFMIDVDFSKYAVGDVVTISFDYIVNEIHALSTQMATTVYAGKNNNPIPVTLSSGDWKISGRLTAVITIIAGMNPYVEVRLCGNSITVKNVMLNAGSTAMPYEPYGFKLPLTVNGTEHPIYLGEVSTTRMIKKIVFDGTEEGWEKSATRAGCFALRGFGTVVEKAIYCTHATYVSTASQLTSNNTCYMGNDFNIWLDLFNEQTTNEQFKSYLAAQYAAGTPVTVWYVLAEPETGIVNEPLHKIGNYADTISMAQAGVTLSTTKGFNTITTDTTVLPSNIEVKGVINNA